MSRSSTLPRNIYFRDVDIESWTGRHAQLHRIATYIVDYKTIETAELFPRAQRNWDFPLEDAPLAPVSDSREYRKKYNDSMQILVRLIRHEKSAASSPDLLDDSQSHKASKTRYGRFMGFNKDNPRLTQSRIMAYGRNSEAVRLFVVRPEYPYPFDYHET
jgi:hypothetical protein